MIDVHAHLGKVIYGYPPLTPEKLLRFMDTYGIEQSVILPLVSPEEEDYPYTTEQALQDCSHVVARAAERLQLRRTTLVEKMRKYELLQRDASSED